MLNNPSHLYVFGPFVLNARERLLFRDGCEIHIVPKAVDTLLALVESSGRVVEKNDLMSYLWPDSFVEENNLAQYIFLLRRTLGNREDGSEYIETVSKRGYRFTAEVSKVDEYREESIESQPPNGPGQEAEKVEGESANPASETVNNQHPALSRQRRHWLKPALFLGLIVSIFASAVIYLYSRATIKAEAISTPKSIAVLPFKSVGSQEESEILGLGMTDAIIIKLSELHEPVVLPTSSVFKYVKDSSDAISIGRQLGVEAVLEGMIQRSDNQIRITARLIRIRDGGILWVDKFDEPYSNIFVLQDVISSRLAQSLVPQLQPGTRERMDKRHLQNMEAYEAYTNGIYFWNKRNKESITKAIFYFREAIRHDPTYALAYAMLSDCYLLSIHYQYRIVPAEEARKLRDEAGMRALELDPNLAEAHLATVEHWIDVQNLEAAESAYQTAIRLNPNHAIARTRYANHLFHTLRLEQALMQAKRGHELDPVAPTTNSAVCSFLYFSRQLDEAVKYCEKAIELEPHATPSTHNLLGIIYQEKGQYDKALAQYQKVAELRPVDASMAIAQVYAMTGRRAEANKILLEVLKFKDQPHFNSYRLSRLYLALGNKEKALEWLELGLDKVKIAWLQYDQELDGLRAEPRFKELIRRLGSRKHVPGQ